MTLADAILEIAKLLPGVADKLVSEKEKRRNEICEFVKSLTNCAERMVEGFEKKEIPHENCAELAAYLNSFTEMVGGPSEDLWKAARGYNSLEDVFVEKFGAIGTKLYEVFSALVYGPDSLTLVAEHSLAKHPEMAFRHVYGGGPGQYYGELEQNAYEDGIVSLKQAVGKLRAFEVLIRTSKP